MRTTSSHGLNASRVLVAIAAAFTFGAFVLGCGAGTPLADAPIPRSESRETLVASVDLAKTASCVETFELAMYEDRNVELIEWSPPSRESDRSPSCEGRVARIRFLKGHTDRARVLELARAHAVRVTESKGTP